MLREYEIISTSSVIWFTIRHRQQISVVEIESVFNLKELDMKDKEDWSWRRWNDRY